MWADKPQACQRQENEHHMTNSDSHQDTYMESIEIDRIMAKRREKLIEINKNRREELQCNHYNEGYCAFCMKHNVLVSPYDFEVCNTCREKYIPKEYIKRLSNPKSEGFCAFSGHWTKQIEKINIYKVHCRLCVKCALFHAKIERKISNAGGYRMLKPEWQKIRKKYGKDYNEILETRYSNVELTKIKGLCMGI